LAHLRNGDTPARLAAGFGVGATTAWRYIREAVDLLAATGPTLAEAMMRIAQLACAILDGTLIPTDRIGGAADRRHYAGKHRHHGVNVQVIGDCAGRLIWLSAALPGSTHDLTAARSSGTTRDHRCRTTRRKSTAPTPASAASANVPSLPSNAGNCWPNCSTPQVEKGSIPSLLIIGMQSRGLSR